MRAVREPVAPGRPVLSTRAAIDHGDDEGLAFDRLDALLTQEGQLSNAERARTTFSCRVLRAS